MAEEFLQAAASVSTREATSMLLGSYTLPELCVPVHFFSVFGTNQELREHLGRRFYYSSVHHCCTNDVLNMVHQDLKDSI